MNKCTSLPGISLVCYLMADRLPADIPYMAMAGMPVSGYEQPRSITLTDIAVCDVEEQEDNNFITEKVKLTFYTLAELPIRQHLAFVIRTMEGKYYLIGARGCPYPTVKVTRTTGKPEGDPSVRKYEVSYTARKALAALSV
jgi:hypothetical protein